ncbi:N-acetylmuramoyl-L-alanine amidase [Lysinibacillus sp. NPDC097231]|uniref:N-acetylmuramoyl-L-alanine amidase n=1 Tax=Lysinibacillus sp. NPDC097231 TaxID=3364142 RepID=UPI0037FAC51C
MANIEKIKVYIDPGHGNPFPGASGNGLIERDVVLQIANACNTQLKAYGATTKMSRTTASGLSTDLTTDLNARVTGSNSFGANVFVSIHNNAATNTSANGVETLIHSQASSYNRALAAKVNSVVAVRTGMAQRPTPVVERNDIRVLYRDNNAWAILVEVGFLSNASDAAKLNTDAKCTVAGKAIAEAIQSYVNSLPAM